LMGLIMRLGGVYETRGDSCSNFRARAMKRFGVEWRNGAYWDGEKIIDNPEATMRVNSEIGS
ncbi:hypothetical protein, partial [Stutzerimonas kunmingensis]|uniref:hypothetical protein n=1 Tax=Stutzerimonas kunmingensis TaxID=1211807 RepID=UPI0028A29706